MLVNLLGFGFCFLYDIHPSILLLRVLPFIRRLLILFP
jgi:hypothetical protein